VKEVSFKSGVKGQGSDRWWERIGGDCDEDAKDQVNQEEYCSRESYSSQAFRVYNRGSDGTCCFGIK